MKSHRHAEAWYLIIISSIIVTLTVMQFLSWSFWHEEITGNPETMMWYWVGQLGIGGIVLVGGFLGFTPRVHVTWNGLILAVSQGRRSSKINPESITNCQIIPALRYYREWDRRVERYMTHIPDDVLLIFTESGTTAIAIGINPDAHAVLLTAIHKIEPTEVKALNAV
ncbi:MAG: hypothetical protein OXE92_06145 [Bacteroidetes bacterium]|nr:hypothetical protein [Bacteroidota bacterium]MCY4205289.1 hypothetical protein [Bacteroidota bacterium]